MSLNIRLKKILNDNNMTQSQLAKEWGVKPAYVNQLISGKNSIGLNVIKQILNTFKNVNARWLIFGEEIEIVPTKDSESSIDNKAKDALIKTLEDRIEELKEDKKWFKDENEKLKKELEKLNSKQSDLNENKKHKQTTKTQ